jgi:trehalose-6-phosphatase
MTFMSKEFLRKSKEDKPVVAICYDFDKTLSPDDMQAQGYIQSVGYEVESFWKESNGLAEENDMDQNLAYMFTMIQKAHGKFVFNREALMDYGAKVKLFPGVDTWFKRIREYGESKGVIVEHYIISSGLKEMIEGTKVADEFEKIYASSFYYDKDGVAQWPAQVINYTSKTQFLFRIEKGTLDVNDFAVNDYFEPENIRIPFRNMIYIGDSDTDMPCMKLINTNSGHSIGVFNPETQDKRKVYKMMEDKRIKYFAPADYTENSELDILVNTSKTQFLFRIEKGTLDVNDFAVNDYFEPENIRIPFRNMIYIGDSDTDMPCMKLINTNSGHSIGVFNPETQDKRKVYKMMEDKRIKYFAPADYTENSELDILVKTIIEQTASNEKLVSFHYKNQKEQLNQNINVEVQEVKEKEKLILDLENSNSFARTHFVISKLKAFNNWSDKERQQLKQIAEKNNQVSYIKDDEDIAFFYSSLG